MSAKKETIQNVAPCAPHRSFYQFRLTISPNESLFGIVIFFSCYLN